MGSAHSAALESAKKGDVEAIKKLLQRSDVKEWLNKGDKDARTPLHLASFENQLEVVKLLLSSEAIISCTDNTGKTPLHWASFKGHLEVVKLLLYSGAFVDIVDSLRESAIGMAFRFGCSSVVDLFIAMELKGQLCYQGDDGGSLLHLVCKEKEVKVDLVKMLLERGLNAAKRDKSGKLPLDYVSDEEKKAEVSQLITRVPSKKEVKMKKEKAERQGCKFLDMAMKSDRKTLEELFEKGNGSQWEDKYKVNWNSERPFREWAGIESSFINNDERVLEIIMRGNERFTGKFPNLFPLVNLVSIDLDHCKLSGPIPRQIGDLIHLTYLNLSFNSFTGGIPEEIGNLHCLTFLSLNRNPLGGTIPTSIQHMYNLEYLWLANCQLTGHIPLEIGRLKELRDLILCENNLTGKIPQEIGIATKLDRLVLSMNELSGSIPPSLGQCKSLTVLYLDRNNFTRQLPVEVSELPQLKELWLYRTNITVDGHPIAKMGRFLTDRLPGVDVVVEQPSTPSKMLVRKDNCSKGVDEQVKAEDKKQRPKEEREKEEVAPAHKKKGEEKSRLERKKEDRLRQLEEENQRLKADKMRLEQQQIVVKSSHDSNKEERKTADRARESQSSGEQVDQLNASMIGASSLGSYGAPSGRGAANETQLPLVPPVTTVKDSSVTGASSLSSTPVSPRRDRKLETASPPVSPMNTVGASSLSSAGREKNSPPMNTVGASSLSSAGREKEQRSTSVSQDNGLSLGARVVEVHDVKLGEVIGQGAFGKVYKGECDFQDVAVKVFECGSSIPEEVAEKVRQEVQVMCQLSHPNIVRLYGLVERADSPPMLVMEFGAGGSLYSYLRRRDFADRPWSHRLRIAFELSRGLAYLHKMNVVHRDIKSLNVILDEYGKAMWCDFGLSVTKEHVLTTSTADDVSGNQEGDRDHVAGTLRWLAPEQFSFRYRVPSRASDVWSLGMVLFEIASQQVPFSASSNRELIKDWIKAGEGEEVPDDCEAKAPVLADLMRRCWSERSARPSAAVIAEELKAVI